MKDKQICLTVQALQRMPYYLQYLEKVKEDGICFITATTIANEMDLNDVVVRKDLSSICTTKGRPNTGFSVDDLIVNIKACLGCDYVMNGVLVGAGSLGRALLGNHEFAKYGLNIVAAFDIDNDIIGTVIRGKKVLPLDEVKNLCNRMNIHVGIIAVPDEFAQEAADQLTSCGIRAIWNFSLVILSVPDFVMVKNENLAASLAVLSQHLRDEQD